MICSWLHAAGFHRNGATNYNNEPCWKDYQMCLPSFYSFGLLY